jgi:general secretion pathway protein F
MPVFEYAALTKAGKSIKGTIESDSTRAARQKLKSQSLYVTDIREGSNDKKNITSIDINKLFESNRIKAQELTVLTRQFATLVGAGLPLVSSLQALVDQTDSLVTRRIILSIKEKVEEGTSLAKALKSYPTSFSSLYINMVASGEESGTLDAVLDNMADYLEAQAELKRKISSALFYPILMFCFCTLVVIGLLTFVVPQIVEIFQKQGAVLPLPTRILLGISAALTGYWWLIIGGVVAIIYGFTAWKKSEEGQKTFDMIVLKMPLIGNLYTKIVTARVSRTLGTLLTTGVSLLTAMDIAKNIVNNVHVRLALENATTGVREGKSLASELSRSGIFPSLLSHMIAVGERSGRMEPMLLKAGKSYEQDVQASLAGLTSLIEPIMIITLGGIVFAIVIAVLMPMVDLINVVQK